MPGTNRDTRTATTDEPEPVQLSLLDQPPEDEPVRFGTEGRPGFDDHGFPVEYDRVAA